MNIQDLISLKAKTLEVMGPLHDLDLQTADMTEFTHLLDTLVDSLHHIEKCIEEMGGKMPPLDAKVNSKVTFLRVKSR